MSARRKGRAAIAGAVIAGGKAARFGGEKPLVPFRGVTLLEAVVARVRPQVDALALNLREEAAALCRVRYGGDLPVLLDTLPGKIGPLAGIVAALEWASSLEGVRWLATFPGDTPFLPENLVATLAGAASRNVPVVARDGERLHYLCALWPIDCMARLRENLVSGRWRSLYRTHEELGAVSCIVDAPAHAFFNVNTAEDLAEAERLAAL